MIMRTDVYEIPNYFDRYNAINDKKLKKKTNKNKNKKQKKNYE